MDGAECFRKGLLQRTRPQPDLARKDLRQASFFLKEAEELLALEKRVMATLALYNAFFHASRSILFSDGVKERSHFCIARYLEEEHVKKKRLETRFLDAFETAMSARHNAQYSTEEVIIEEDLAELTNICGEMIETVGKRMKP